MRIFWRIMLVGLLIAFGAVDAPAAEPRIHLALPLRGYFHPGRYMPVRAICDLREFTSQSELQLTGPAAMTTDAPLSRGRIDAVLPWLCYEPMKEGPEPKIWSYARKLSEPSSVRLRPLADDQKLVGYAAGDVMQAMQLAHVLFTANGHSPEVFSVPLDTATPLPGPIAAWESLDLLVIDASAAVPPTLDQQKLAALVASGVAVALRDRSAAAIQPPYSHWPWRHVVAGDGQYWVLQYAPSGPSLTYNDDVYRPVDSWRLRWPRRFRMEIIGGGAVFSILLLGGLLLLKAPAEKPLKLWLGIGILALMTAAGMSVLGYWWHQQTPVLSCAGDVILINRFGDAGATPASMQSSTGKSLVQIDSWVFEASAASSVIDVSWADITHPMAASRQHLQTCAPILCCASNGEPVYVHIVLPPLAKMALLSRTVGPQAPHAAPATPITSPLLELVRQYYLAPGDEILGQLAAVPPILSAYQDQGQWPAVVIETSGPGPATRE